VSEALGPDADGVSVQGVLCFTNADLPLLGVTRIRGHMLLYRKALAKLLNRPGPIEPAAIDSLARRLANRFPAA
jgi:hypothetical protein